MLTYTDLLELPCRSLTLLANCDVLAIWFMITLIIRTLIIVDEAPLILLSNIVVIVCVVILILKLGFLDFKGIWIYILVSFHDQFLAFYSTLFQNTCWPFIPLVIYFRLLNTVFRSCSRHQGLNFLNRWWINTRMLVVVSLVVFLNLVNISLLVILRFVFKLYSRY